MSKRFSATRPLFVGFSTVLVLLVTLGSWGALTQIAGAVVASGQVQVESDRQVVQHPDGGVVSEILVRDGDAVKAGDVLIRLDGTFLRSELLITERQLAEATARRARLEAERDGTESIVQSEAKPYILLSNVEIATQIEGQRRFFEARSASLAQETSQLKEQILQTEQQIVGFQAQAEAAERQLLLVRDELKDVQTLFDQGLIQASRLLELQRSEASLGGEIGRITAQIAEARTRISSTEIDILKLSDDRRSNTINELRDLELSQGELLARQLSLGEQLSRLDVRAPVSGIVFDSRVAARQSVVQPAEPLLYLVPGDQPLQVAARIDPVDVDQVYAGQDASLMFTTFNSRTTPEVPGRVLRVSADSEQDETTGLSFYEAIVVPDNTVLAEMEGIQLLPGMPVETFLKTDERTPISYLIQPLTVYLNRAFREE